MNGNEFAARALEHITLPTRVSAVVADDIAAGEYLSSLIEVLELAPEIVPAKEVNGLSAVLGSLDEADVYRQVGERAIARARHLATA